MKYFCIISLFCLLAACSSNTPKQEAQNHDSSAHQAPAITSTDIEPEKKLNGNTIVARNEWQEGQSTYLAAVSREYEYARKYGALRVECWVLGNTEPDLKWQYMDSMSCTKGDVAVSYSLDRLYTEDIDLDGSNDVVVLYTLACAQDAAPQPRHMLVFDKTGKILVKLMGKSLEPQAPATLDARNMDLQSTPGTADPLKNQGRIDNYSDLDKLPPAGKKRLLELWREGLAKDKRVSVLEQ